MCCWPFIICRNFLVYVQPVVFVIGYGVRELDPLDLVDKMLNQTLDLSEADVMFRVRVQLGRYDILQAVSVIIISLVPPDVHEMIDLVMPICQA